MNKNNTDASAPIEMREVRLDTHPNAPTLDDGEKGNDRSCCGNLRDQIVFSILGPKLEEEGMVRVERNKRNVIAVAVVMTVMIGLFSYTYFNNQQTENPAITFALINNATVCIGDILVLSQGANLTFGNATNCQAVATCEKNYEFSSIVFPLVLTGSVREPSSGPNIVLVDEIRGNPTQRCKITNNHQCKISTRTSVHPIQVTVPVDLITMKLQQGMCVKLRTPPVTESISVATGLCTILLLLVLPCTNCLLGRKSF